eukprot:gene8743-691_t
MDIFTFFLSFFIYKFSNRKQSKKIEQKYKKDTVKNKTGGDIHKTVEISTKTYNFKEDPRKTKEELEEEEFNLNENKNSLVFGNLELFPVQKRLNNFKYEKPKKQFFHQQNSDENFGFFQEHKNQMKRDEDETFNNFEKRLSLVDDSNSENEKEQQEEEDFLSQNYQDPSIDEGIQNLNLFENNDKDESLFNGFRENFEDDFEEDSKAKLMELNEKAMKNDLQYSSSFEKLIDIKIPSAPVLTSQISKNTYMNPKLTHHQFVNVKADGNCFYRSISYCLYKTEKYHVWMRFLTLIEFLKRQEFYIKFLEKLQIDPLEIYKTTKALGHNGWATDVHIKKGLSIGWNKSNTITSSIYICTAK